MSPVLTWDAWKSTVLPFVLTYFWLAMFYSTFVYQDLPCSLTAGKTWSQRQ